MDRGAALDALARPELLPLWESARRRLERNGRTITSSPMELTGLSDAEVSNICMLLSRRRPRNNNVRFSLAELDDTLRASSISVGLIDALETLSGPVIDRRAQRASARDKLEDLWSAAESHPAARSEEIAQWLVSVRRRGRLTRLSVDHPAVVLTTALDFLHRMTIDGNAAGTNPLPLAAVAADTLGDAHALDPETPLGSLVMDAVMALSGSTDLRSAWRTFGVDLDSVSASALCFMVPGEAGSIVRTARSMAEPLRITGRMLDRGLGLDVKPGDVVSICENPSIVMIAADRLGAACGALVCLEGMPSGVTSRLLFELRRLGATLRVHTDFDFGGIAIMNHITSRHGAEPWLMSSTDYVVALKQQTTALDRLVGATSWDLELSTAMNVHRRAVHEEAIAEALLADLER